MRATLAAYGEIFRQMWRWLRTDRHVTILLAIIILQQLALALAFFIILEDQKVSLAEHQVFKQALQDERDKHVLQPKK